MPKIKKSRRKSRNQKCASKTELTTTLDKNGPDGNEKSTGSNEDVPCDSLEPSEKKRKSLHDATSTNDAQLQESVPSLARKKKKRKRSAHEALQNQIDVNSIPDSNGNNEGMIHGSTLLSDCMKFKMHISKPNKLLLSLSVCSVNICAIVGSHVVE